MLYDWTVINQDESESGCMIFIFTVDNPEEKKEKGVEKEK